MKTVICRYCGESFTPASGKPGYIDECSACLHEKTSLPIPKAGRLSASDQKMIDRWVKQTEKDFEKLRQCGIKLNIDARTYVMKMIGMSRVEANDEGPEKT